MEPWHQTYKWRNEMQRSSAPLVLAFWGLTSVSEGLRFQRMNFFCSKTELSHLVMEETLRTEGKTDLFSPINLTTTAHILLCVSPRNAFLATPWKDPIPTRNTITNFDSCSLPWKYSSEQSLQCLCLQDVPKKWETYVGLTLKQSQNPEISIWELSETLPQLISLALGLPQSMQWIHFILHTYGTKCRELNKWLMTIALIEM